MREYDSAQPLISLHVPKTAGTSLRAMLQAGFDLVLPHYNKWLHDGLVLRRPEWYDWSNLCQTAKTRPIAIHGHFRKSERAFVTDYYPEASQMAVLLRDPLDATVSLYYYYKALRARGGIAPIDDRPLDAFLMGNTLPFANHLPGGMLDDPEPYIKQHFVAVGVMEDIAAYARALSKATGLNFPEPPHVNAAPRTEGPSKAAAAAFKDRYKREYAVYDAVRALA